MKMNKLYLSIALSLGLLTSVYCIMTSQGTERFAWICSTIYAATSGGLSISTNGGNNFTNKTTTNGLNSNIVYKLYII